MTQPSRDTSIELLSDEMKKPTTFKEVVGFYYRIVKPLYATVQSDNQLPQEILFEINAAFDHFTRYFQNDEPEQAVVPKVYSHLKRSCLDVFKLGVKAATDQYAELRSIDTSVIDNGNFDQELVELFTAIRVGARNAKVREGDFRASDAQAELAFSLWSPVWAHCVDLDTRFYQHPKLVWAKRRQAEITDQEKAKQIREKKAERRAGLVTGLVTGCITGILTSVAGCFVYAWMTTPRAAPASESTTPAVQVAPAAVPTTPSAKPPVPATNVIR